jgi:protein TonB
MEPSKILSATLIDVIFDGRNKEYGAYELRKTDSQRTKVALSVTISVVALVLTVTSMATSFKKDERTDNRTPGIVLTEYEEVKPPEELPKPERQPEEQVQTQKFTPPEIVPDEEFTEPPPSQEDLIDTKIGLVDIRGVKDSGIAVPPGEIDGKKGIVDIKPPAESDDPFVSVEIDAKFNGNWKSFLERNLNGNVPLDNNAAPGRYSVVIQFVVDKEGTVSDIKPLTNHGYGMEAEAVRVLRKADKWEPAIQNGQKVKAYRKQVIVFEVLEE